MPNAARDHFLVLTRCFCSFGANFTLHWKKFCTVLTVTHQWPADLNRDQCSRRKWHFMSGLLIQPSTSLWPWEANLARQHPWERYMALRKQPNSQNAFAFLCRSFYFSGEITTARSCNPDTSSKHPMVTGKRGVKS